MRKSRVVAHSKSILLALTALPIAGGCGGPPMEGDQAGKVVSPHEAIYNGVVMASQANAGPLGVPLLYIGATGCSAVVYNKYWLITAAHCFCSDGNACPVVDPQGAWVYWNTNIPGSHYATALQTSAGNQDGTLNILAGFRSPDISQDTALVLLDPTSAGVYTPAIVAYTANRYSNGHLVIYDLPNSNLIGQQVLAYGWGPTSSGGSFGSNLTRGYKNVASISPDNNYYYDSPYNNAGTSCNGDSGGPDFWWDGGGMQLTGTHGEIGCAQGVGGRNNASQAFRTWVTNTAATLPMAGSVSGEALSGWPASAASDYNPFTSYSSLSFPSSANNRNGLAVWLQTYLATASTVNRVNLRARCSSFGYNPNAPSAPPSCVVNAFPASYTVYVWNGAWNYGGTFTQQPDNMGVVSLPIPAVANATAVRITPLQLGKDTNGTYYFQMAELQPAYDL